MASGSGLWTNSPPALQFVKVPLHPSSLQHFAQRQSIKHAGNLEQERCSLQCPKCWRHNSPMLSQAQQAPLFQRFGTVCEQYSWKQLQRARVSAGPRHCEQAWFQQLVRPTPAHGPGSAGGLPDWSISVSPVFVGVHVCQ